MPRTPNPNPLMLACLICSTPFRPRPRNLRRGMAKYCSVACALVARRNRPAVESSAYVAARTLVGPDCWAWTGKRDATGYGRACVDNRHTLAHRLAWELASGGEVPEGLLVCHTCDNPNCVRNDEAGVYVVADVAYPRFGHLWLGTTAANMADRDAKGRAVDNTGRPGPAGEASPNARITEATARRIHSLSGSGLTRAQIAAEVDTSFSIVKSVRAGRTWKHIALNP